MGKNDQDEARELAREQAADKERRAKRFELAKAAISGTALHSIDKINLMADRAVAIADSVLAALDKATP